MHSTSMCEPQGARQRLPRGLPPFPDHTPSTSSDDPADAYLRLSPLHWLILAGARAVPSPLSSSQLNQLFQDALCCVPEGAPLEDLPALPAGAPGAERTPCSLAAYILRQCAAAPGS